MVVCRAQSKGEDTLDEPHLSESEEHLQSIKVVIACGLRNRETDGGWGNEGICPPPYQ